MVAENTNKNIGKTVLVGVLKSKSDLKILLKDRWYRIPAASTPKRQFKYVAFYQPAIFGRNGKRIMYYARAVRKIKMKRIDLLPKEVNHPRANDNYIKITFREIKKLSRPIKNIVPRRVSFGFTSLKNLLSAKDILELYGVSPTEQIIEKRLKRLGIKFIAEYPISLIQLVHHKKENKRYRIDIAVSCRKGMIAIECDNEKAHSGKAQVARDKAKDVLLKCYGWQVIRLKESDIIGRLDYCLGLVEGKVKKLGGQNEQS